MKTKTKIVLAITPALVLLDQVSKFWIYGNLKPGRDEIVVIPGFLSFIHAQNPGAALGMFDEFEYRLVLFFVFAAVAVGVLWNMHREIPDDDRFQATTIALILAGAFGNLIDRIHKQTVTDFIKMYTEWPPLADLLRASPLGSNEWPTYNVADIAIVGGVAMYLLHYLIWERDAQAAKPLDGDGKTPAGPA